jgi:hypothetical protein
VDVLPLTEPVTEADTVSESAAVNASEDDDADIGSLLCHSELIHGQSDELYNEHDFCQSLLAFRAIRSEG